MATLTKLETKLAEVLGLAMAAQDSVRQVRGMLAGEHPPLAKRLAQAREEARETQKRCAALASSFKGNPSAVPKIPAKRALCQRPRRASVYAVATPRIRRHSFSRPPLSRPSVVSPA